MLQINHEKSSFLACENYCVRGIGTDLLLNMPFVKCCNLNITRGKMRSFKVIIIIISMPNHQQRPSHTLCMKTFPKIIYVCMMKEKTFTFCIRERIFVRFYRPFAFYTLCQRWLLTTGAIYSLKRYFCESSFYSKFSRQFSTPCNIYDPYFFATTCSRQSFLFLHPPPRALCDDVVHRRLLYFAL